MKKHLFGLIESFEYGVGKFANDPNPTKHKHWTLKIGKFSIIYNEY